MPDAPLSELRDGHEVVSLLCGTSIDLLPNAVKTLRKATSFSMLWRWLSGLGPVQTGGKGSR